VYLTLSNITSNISMNTIDQTVTNGESITNDKMCCEICDPKCKYNNCICPSSWKNFDETLSKIKNVSSEVLSESLRISTITLCFNLNSNINSEELLKKYESKNKGKFYNSLIFSWHTKYQFKTLVSVKLFPNGKVQIAGLCNVKSCAYIIRKIYNKVYDYLEDKNAKISDINIVMINSDFKISGIFNLANFCNVLSKYNIQSNGNFLSIVYQPIKYPAINTKFICDSNLKTYFEHTYKHSFKKKFTSTISILIFRSGSIIITGGNNLMEYLTTFEYLLNLIDTNKNEIMIN
jgi:TATA-box binding protein (TBP) (component of TFIID and TFIIIB)